MSSSLRDQLIQAGLATEKQGKEVSHQQRHRGRSQPRQPTAEEKQAAQRAQAEKTARDQELNRQRQAKIERRARMAQIKQWIEQGRLPRVESEDRYNFVDEKRVGFVCVDAALREKLNRGEVAIARYERGYAVVPAELASRIRERDERAVVSLNLAPASAAADENDPYKDFAVPDDLKW